LGKGCKKEMIREKKKYRGIGNGMKKNYSEMRKRRKGKE